MSDENNEALLSDDKTPELNVCLIGPCLNANRVCCHGGEAIIEKRITGKAMPVLSGGQNFAQSHRNIIISPGCLGETDQPVCLLLQI